MLFKGAITASAGYNFYNSDRIAIAVAQQLNNIIQFQIVDT
ncbi:hypothetical protein [Nostoc sp.]